MIPQAVYTQIGQDGAGQYYAGLIIVFRSLPVEYLNQVQNDPRIIDVVLWRGNVYVVTDPGLATREEALQFLWRQIDILKPGWRFELYGVCAGPEHGAEEFKAVFPYHKRWIWGDGPTPPTTRGTTKPPWQQ